MLAICWRLLVATLASALLAPASVTSPTSMPGVEVFALEATPDADLFVEPDLIVLPTYVSGDVARLRITVKSRRDAPLEIEQIEIHDLRFAVRVPGGWSGKGSDRVPCEPPLRIEPRGSLALEFETPTRRHVGVFRKTIAAKVRGSVDPIRLADVSARIALGYSVTPWNVEFGDVLRGRTPELEAVVEGQEIGAFRILAVVPIEEDVGSPKFTVATRPDADANASRRHVVTVKLEAAAPLGQWCRRFDLETDSPQHVTVSLDVHARVRPNLELRMGDRIVEFDASLNLGVLRQSADPIEIVVRDLRPTSDWSPGNATLTITNRGGAAADDPKFAIETASGATNAERRISLRLLEPPGPSCSPAVSGELRLPLHHADLDELVLRWRAFFRGR